VSFSFGLSDPQDEEGLYKFASSTHQSDKGLLEGDDLTISFFDVMN
jgi:hypothetical protein